MTVAISAVVAIVATMFTLSNISINTQPPDTILNAILSAKTFTADYAATALLYAAVSYIGAFSISLFALRFLGLFAAAFGIPDDLGIRRNREINRQNTFLLSAQRRQARLTAQYIIRLQNAASQRRAADARRRSINPEIPET